MNEHKLKLLEYIKNNYEKVVKPAQGGEYIEIDLIPNGDKNKLYNLLELYASCLDIDIDIYMITRSYTVKIGDGIRMGRYMYFMQETTKEILNDLKEIN